MPGLVRVAGCDGRLLESRKDAVAKAQCVVEGLQPRGRLRPGGVAEIARLRPSGDDQLVIWHRMAVAQDALAMRVHAGHCRHQHVGTLRRGNDATQRRGDIRWRKRRRRDLVQQRLEQVMVVGLDDREIDIAPMLESQRRLQAAEPSADHHHPAAGRRDAVSRPPGCGGCALPSRPLCHPRQEQHRQAAPQCGNKGGFRTGVDHAVHPLRSPPLQLAARRRVVGWG